MLRKSAIQAVIMIGMICTLLFGLGNPASVTERHSGTDGGIALQPVEMPVLPSSAVLRGSVSLPVETFLLLQSVTERYEEEHPHIDIRLTNETPARMKELMDRRALMEGEPDFMLIESNRVRYEAASGRLLALDDVMADRPAQWFDTVVGSVQWNGYLWGVPAVWDPYVLVHREMRQWSAFDVRSGISALNPERSGGVFPNDDPLGRRVLAELLNEEPEEIGEAAGTAPADGSAALEAVLESAARWTFLPLAAALAYADQHRREGGREELAVAVPPSKTAGGVSLAPFVGFSFVVSPAVKYPNEAADYIRYITEQDALAEWTEPLQKGWSVYRRIPNEAGAEEPSLESQTFTFPLDVDTLLRWYDRIAPPYGDPVSSGPPPA